MTDEVEDSEITFIMYAVSVMLTLMPLLLSLHVENINKLALVPALRAGPSPD